MNHHLSKEYLDFINKATDDELKDELTKIKEDEAQVHMKLRALGLTLAGRSIITHPERLDDYYNKTIKDSK